MTIDTLLFNCQNVEDIDVEIRDVDCNILFEGQGCDIPEARLELEVRRYWLSYHRRVYQYCFTCQMIIEVKGTRSIT